MIKINKNLMNRNHTVLKRQNKDIQWIVIHYVGALGDAKANTDYYKSNDIQASADFWVGFKGDIWQGNDYRNYYSWHSGGGYQSSWTKDGGGQYYRVALNKNSVAIQMCVKKKNTSNLVATDTDWYFEDATVDAAAQLTAYLMKDLDIDIDHVIRHYDVNRKICPAPYVHNYQAWLDFKKKVASYAAVTNVKTYYYRVRSSWLNAKSQLGAYTILENAKVNCPYGYAVYDESGKELYRNSTAPSKISEAKGIPASKQDFISKVAKIAVALYPETKILPSIAIGQCCLETGFGLGKDSTILVKNNNLLGMKAALINNTWKEHSVWNGETVTKRTPEVYNGKLTYINDTFRVYKDYQNCIRDYQMFLSWATDGKNYKYREIIGKTDPAQVIHIIRSHGYATDPSYEEKVLRVIKENNLTQYDKMVNKTVTVPVKPLNASKINSNKNANKLSGKRQKQESGASTKSGTVLYRVQCGVFGVEENCDNMIKQMAHRGFKAVKKKVGKMFVAQAGIYSVRQNAAYMEQRLEKAGLPHSTEII